jgi:hypothetical protein
MTGQCLLPVYDLKIKHMTQSMSESKIACIHLTTG